MADVEFTQVTARMQQASRGFTVIDGALWVPLVHIDLKNNGSKDIKHLYLLALFLDHEDVI